MIRVYDVREDALMRRQSRHEKCADRKGNIKRARAWAHRREWILLWEYPYIRKRAWWKGSVMNDSRTEGSTGEVPCGS